MVSIAEKDKLVNGRQSNVTLGQQKASKMLTERPSKDGTAQRAAQDVEGLKGYVRGSDLRQEQANIPLQQLGDCLGKGAFGSVYRALNWGTGETVAIKQVRLADLPKTELKSMMVSISPSMSETIQY
jgi:hypothetical protein